MNLEDMVREDGSLVRLSTGVNKLDKLIDGGYPLGRSVLISGGPGVGKTLLAIHFADAACREGLRCLYLATEESPDDLIIQAKQLGIDFAAYRERKLLDILPILDQRMDDLKWQRGKNPATYIFKQPLNAISLSNADVVVIDNLSSYHVDVPVGVFREHMDHLVHSLRQKAMTALLISDETLNERYVHAALHAVYGAFHMEKRENPFTGNVERLINVVKMRGTTTPLDYVKYTITGEGINILHK